MGSLHELERFEKCQHRKECMANFFKGYFFLIFLLILIMTLVVIKEW